MKSNYEKEFIHGKDDAHEHCYRSKFFILYGHLIFPKSY